MIDKGGSTEVHGSVNLDRNRYEWFVPELLVVSLVTSLRKLSEDSSNLCVLRDINRTL